MIKILHFSVSTSGDRENNTCFVMLRGDLHHMKTEPVSRSLLCGITTDVSVAFSRLQYR